MPAVYFQPTNSDDSFFFLGLVGGVVGNIQSRYAVDTNTNKNAEMRFR